MIFRWPIQYQTKDQYQSGYPASVDYEMQGYRVDYLESWNNIPSIAYHQNPDIIEGYRTTKLIDIGKYFAL